MTRRPSKTKLILSVLGLLLVVVLLYQWWTGAPAKGTVAEVQADYGTYDALTPAQKRLVDDWVERFGQATGKRLVAHELYDALPVASRTTFGGVTHALSRTAAPATTTSVTTGTGPACGTGGAG